MSKQLYQRGLILLVVTIMIAIMCLGGIIINIREKSPYTKNVGKKVLYNEEVLTIIDYSPFSKTYTLSNKVEVEQDFLEESIEK